MNNPYLKEDGSYYYGYGYNQGGYGYGGYDAGSQRNLKDYLLIFRERIWYFIPTFFIILAAAIVYTFNVTPIYRSTATVQLLRDDPQVMQTQQIEVTEIRGTEDFNTQVMLMESLRIVDAVDKRLIGEDRAKFMEPYQSAGGMEGTLSAAEILFENRKVEPARLSLIVSVSFEHPNPKIAALVANLFAEEFINFNLNQTIDVSNKAVEDLRLRAEVQRKKVEELEMRLNQYKEENNSISIDSEENIAIQEIQRLNELVVMRKSELDVFATRVSQMESILKEQKDLWELPFIASNTRVGSLLNEVSRNKIQVATLAQRYRDKHPSMIQAREALSQSEKELTEALRSVQQEIRSDYDLARRGYESAEARLRAKEQSLMVLGKLRVEYNAIQSEMEVEKAFYQALVSRMTQELAQVQLKNAQARLVDRAGQPRNPFKPKVLLNIALGCILGFGAGFGLVFLTAFIDDRVKTAYDIESVVGLPLIGIIPRMRKMDASDKAQAVAANADRHVTEAFRTVYSTLRLGEESRKARVILTTSTVPGEGKSFVSTNLAQTFASHGERTLLIDGDLRLPNVGKSMRLGGEKGMVNFFEEGGSVEDFIIHGHFPNLDILPAGAKAKNPTQILNSVRFSELVEQLKQRYDKILIDSPPLAAVSDALNFLPLVDGVVYVIKFNTVKRKTAKVNVKRLWDSSTPVFGAVLNNISAGISSYYYSHYYDRSYRDYYAKANDTADKNTAKAAKREARKKPVETAP